MTKRCDRFEKADRNFYPTPLEAIGPLTHHLSEWDSFIEPCVGDGRLAAHLEGLGYPCIACNDLLPLIDSTEYPNLPTPTALDVTDFTNVESMLARIGGAACDNWVFITNPPWPDRTGRGTPVTSMLDAMLHWGPVWLLLAADFAHNKYAKPYLPKCRKIVSVGRVKWIEDSKHKGVDNAAWFLFDEDSKQEGPVFYPREDGEVRAPWIEGVL